MAAVDNDTIVFVFGDHGMTPTGDHGGETALETDAALLIFTPRPLFDPNQVCQTLTEKNFPLLCHSVYTMVGYTNM